MGFRKIQWKTESKTVIMSYKLIWYFHLMLRENLTSEIWPAWNFQMVTDMIFWTTIAKVTAWNDFSYRVIAKCMDSMWMCNILLNVTLLDPLIADTFFFIERPTCWQVIWSIGLKVELRSIDQTDGWLNILLMQSLTFIFCPIICQPLYMRFEQIIVINNNKSIVKCQSFNGFIKIKWRDWTWK